MKNLKKLYAVLMLVSLVFASVSPAFAAGTVESSGVAFWDDVSGTYKIGSTADFLGYNWTLWKIDDEYAYVITSDMLSRSQFHDSSNYYPTSTIRGVVNGYEKEMKNYTGEGKTGIEALTWEDINDGGSANYIAHSPTTDNGVGTDYLHLLSRGDAETMPLEIRRIDDPWWLRSPVIDPDPSHPIRAYYVHPAGIIGGTMVDDFPVGVRPALIINLKSPIFTRGIFMTLYDLPTLAGNSSTTVLYDGKRWAKLSGTRVIMVDHLGSKSWKDAVFAGKNYASGITDAFESRIKGSSALLTREEAEKLSKSELTFSNYWWLSTTNNKGTPDGVSGLGEIVTMTNRSTSLTRPALELKNADNSWFLSAIGGAKSAEAGKLVTAPETGKEWKITYKDDTLPAPVLSGALTLDAQGNSKWSSPTAGRISAFIGRDGKDAKGYVLMRDKNESGNNEILLNGAEGGDIYIHSEIIGSSYDRISAESVRLANSRNKNGHLSGIKLGKEYSGAENPVTLKNGFELSLASKQLYAQDIASETGENVLRGTGEQGAKLLGNLAVKSGSKLNCEGRLEFTTLQLDGELVIKEGAVVTVTSQPSGTNSGKPLQIEANGTIANRGTKPVEVYDLAMQYKMTVPPGYYYTTGEGEDYKLKKIDWNDPEWEEANGGEGSSSSSGGCNAGFGILALLCAAPMIFRKKH